MLRLLAGTSRSVDGVAVDADADMQVPPRFAPGHEPCVIRYIFRRGHSVGNAMVSLDVAGRDGAVVYQRDMLHLMGDRPDRTSPARIDWQGRNDSGDFVATPDNSPYTITLRVGSFLEVTRRVGVEIAELRLWRQSNGDPDIPDDKVIIPYDPDYDMDVVTTVMMRSATGQLVPTKVPIEVHYGFEAGSDNTPAANSFEYESGRRLGKMGDTNAVLWGAHSLSAAQSDDNFNRTCRVITVTAVGDNLGKAFVHFKPSGVGGDTYRLEARVADSGVPDRQGHAQAIVDQTDVFTIWHKVEFSGVEMTGPDLRHISTHAAKPRMDQFFTNAETFVWYKLGRITRVPDTQYIGLWDSSLGREKTKDEWSARRGRDENPRLSVIGRANRGDRRARREIEQCAQRWYQRISDEFDQSIQDWVRHFHVPDNAVVAIDLLHPKFSTGSFAQDSETSQWTSFSWLRIDYHGTRVHPDDHWAGRAGGFVGLSVFGRAFVASGLSRARYPIVMAHEIGHETRNQFRRDFFRPASVSGPERDSDHSPEPGLMDSQGTVDHFTDLEKQVLRGIIRSSP